MKNISLALSGGGLRAIAFHMGVLKYLSEKTYWKILQEFHLYLEEAY